MKYRMYTLLNMILGVGDDIYSVPEQQQYQCKADDEQCAAHIEGAHDKLWSQALAAPAGPLRAAAQNCHQ